MKIEHIWQISFILISAIVSAYMGYWFGNQPEESLVIEYRKDINKNLKSLIGNTSKIEIKYGNKNLKELSSIVYIINNRTTKNLGKLKIYFEVSDKTNLPIFHNIKTPKSYPKEAITLISKKNGIYIFELEYLNRTKSVFDGLSFLFYFEGENPPEISIKTGTKGLNIKEFKFGNMSPIYIFTFLIKELWWAIIFILLLLYFFNRLDRSQRELQEIYFKKEILNTLNNSEMTLNEKTKKIQESSRVYLGFSRIIKNMFKK